MIVASHLWIGGAESVMQHLAESIDRRRFNVTVCCLKQRGTVGEKLVKKGVDVLSLFPDGKTDYFSFRKLLKVLWIKHIDVVHTHTTHGLVDSSLCSLVMPRLKIVHTFHFGNYPHTNPRILWMERLGSRIADRLVAVGEVQRKQIQAVYGLKDDRIETVYNGVPVRSSQGDPSFRRTIGAEHSVLIGTIATLIPQKGLTYLLDVAKVVQDSGRKAMFVVVGEGPLRAELEAKRDGLGLQGSVIFTGWITNAAEMVLPTFDIFFQPSLWEAMSMVILEAMAAAKPIVATAVGENSRIIEDDVSGLLVQPKAVEEMASALGRLIDDAALRVRFGQEARRRIEQRFTVEQMVRHYEAIYEELMQ